MVKLAQTPAHFPDPINPTILIANNPFPFFDNPFVSFTPISITNQISFMKASIFILILLALLSFTSRNRDTKPGKIEFAKSMQSEKLLLDTVFNLADYGTKFKSAKEHKFNKSITTSNHATLRIEAKSLVIDANNSVVKQVKVFLTKPVKGNVFYAAFNQGDQFNQGTGDNVKTYVILEIWSNTKEVERAFSKLYTIDSDGKIDIVPDQK